MAESSNSLSRAEFKIEVADFLGYTRDSDNWSTGQTTRVEACVNNGYRTFLAPPKLPEQVQAGETAWEWSFMKPWTTLSVTADAWYADAPEDFGNFAAPRLYFDPSTQLKRVDIVASAQIIAKRQLGTTSGTPYIMGVRPKSSDASTGQRYEFVWWPTADDDYTLNYPYYVLQGAMTEDNPYPLGGAAHAMTVLAACLAWADQTYKAGKYGKQEQYLDRLRFSIDHDRRFGWHTLGQLTDSSDDIGSEGQRPFYDIIVEGVTMT